MPSATCKCGRSSVSFRGLPAMRLRLIAPPACSTTWINSFEFLSQQIHHQSPPSSKSPQTQNNCRCADCRNITGAVFSTTIVVSEYSFRSSGSFRSRRAHADGITNHSCDACGTLLFRDSPNFPGLVVIKVEGDVDDELHAVDADSPQPVYAQMATATAATATAMLPRTEESAGAPKDSPGVL